VYPFCVIDKQVEKSKNVYMLDHLPVTLPAFKNDKRIDCTFEPK
jgi:hypothetical protein